MNTKRLITTGDIGDQIRDSKTIAQCEEYYSQLKQKAANSEENETQ